jgi:GDP-mannose 6-dehydrogenase
MKISVSGLGYVGCVSAACLASRGHEVVGVDINPVKIDLVSGGKAPVVDERIGELTAQVVQSGLLRATTRGDRRQRGLPDLRRHTVGAQWQPIHYLP